MFSEKSLKPTSPMCAIRQGISTYAFQFAHINLTDVLLYT